MNDLINFDSKHSLTSESAIIHLMDKMLQEEQADCPVTHHFGPNIYIREVRIKAGVFSVGHYQKTTHLNYMMKGKVLMLQEDGSVKEVSAPFLYTSKPGRKVGLILEDMTWWNIYSTNETDIETLENTYLDKSALDEVETKNQLMIVSRHRDIEDFENMLSELNTTKEQVRFESEIDSDLIDFPYGSFNVSVSDSQIEGKGLFATSDFSEGELICPARINGCRTPSGRYTNHSPNPNAKFIKNGEDIDLIATREISGCKGGQLGEEITVDYRQARSLCQA